jgi:hypothetical protein
MALKAKIKLACGEQGNHQKSIEEFEESISLRKKSKHNEVNQIDNIKTYNDLQIVICFNIIDLINFIVLGFLPQ